MMSKSNVDKDLSRLCPICIETFTSPRCIPSCKHSFCEQCLFTYVSTLKDKGELGAAFSCPVCRQEVPAPPDGHVTLAWIQSFPANEELVNLITETGLPEVKDDVTDETFVPLCDPCEAEGEHNRAVKFCVDCQESLCKTCLDAHRRFKTMKGHRLVDNIKKGRQTNQMKDIIASVDVKCGKHRERDVEIYCPSHDVYCCVTCATVAHRDCKGVQEIADMDLGSNKTMARLKQKYEVTEKLLDQIRVGHEGSIKQLSEKKENVQRLFKQTKDEIMRCLDDLENELNLKKKQFLPSVEGAMESSIVQIKNIQIRCRQNIDRIDILNEFSLPLHKVVMQKDMVEEYVKFEREMDTCEIDVTEYRVEWRALNKLVEVRQAIVESTNESLTVVRQPSDIIRCRNILNQMKDKSLVKTEEHTVRIITDCSPTYTGMTIIESQRLLLCDNCGGKCGHLCLYDPNSKSISKLKMNIPFGAAVLTSKPSHIAVSVPNDKQIHVIANRENDLTIVKTFQTEKKPHSLISLDNGYLGVTWDSPPSFDIADVNGSELKIVKSYTQDSTGRKFESFQYVAVDELRSRIIQPCTGKDAVYCFDYSDNPVFEYRDTELKGPRGVDIDRDGNIYICSYRTHTLHVLTPSGRKVKVIKEGVPRCPLAICFDETREKRFWVTCGIGNYDKVSAFDFHDKTID